MVSKMNRDEIKEAIMIGKKLAKYKLIDGASGNISFRFGNKITITKRGVMLDELNENSFIDVEIGKKDYTASSDLYVHNKIYELTDFTAVIHCHGIYNVTLSLLYDEIRPIDLEGRMFIGNVKVVEGKFGDEKLAKRIAKEIAEKGVCLVRGHGIYSAGSSLTDAFKTASYLEHSCEILYRFEILRKIASLNFSPLCRI